MGEPPSEIGADHNTVTYPSAATTPVIVGALGVPSALIGVATSETPEAAPEPALLVAVSEKVYGEPFVRPVTAQDVDADSQVSPPGAAVTVYFEIAAPPSEAGADHDTVT